MKRARWITLLLLSGAAFAAARVFLRGPEAKLSSPEPPAHVAAAEQFLRRHAANLLAGEGAATSDFVVDAVAGQPARPLHLRTFVRRRPFGFRRELRATPEGLPVVHVSDGRTAWRLLPEGPPGRGELLRGEEARLLLEAAWIDGLRYLDVSGLAQRLMLGPAMSLPVLPGTPREFVLTARVQPMVAYLPSGLELRLYFDPADGRLLGLANPTIVPQRNVRYFDHRQFGPLRLSASRLDNRGAGLSVRTDVQAVRCEPLPPELFAGNPAVVPAGVIDASPIERVATAIPGACYFMLPGVRVSGRPVGAALFDTGAGRTHLTPRLADALGLAVLSPRGASGVAGHARGTRRWIDAIDLPGFSFVQIEVTAMDLPFTAQLGDGSLPELVFGNELLTTSPVLDLRRGRLLLRGAPVEPLAGEGVFSLPLSRQRFADVDVLPIDVGGRRLDVALDTGMPFALRLTRSGLLRAGLPADAATWRARCAGDGHRRRRAAGHGGSARAGRRGPDRAVRARTPVGDVGARRQSRQ